MPNTSQQIDLLFGVKGNSSINEGSGYNIKKDIDAIVSQINAKMTPIKFQADYIEVKKAEEILGNIDKQLDAIRSKAVLKFETGAKGSVSSDNLPVLTVKADTTQLNDVEAQLENIRRLISTMPELAVGKDLESELSKAYKAAKGTYKEFLGKESDFKLLDTNLDNEDVREAVELHEKLLELAKGFTDSERLIVKKTAFDDAANEKYEEFTRIYDRYVAKLKDGNKATKAAEQANKNNTKEIMNGQVMLNKLYNSYNKFENIKDYPNLVAKYDELVAKIKNYDKDDNGNLLISAEEVKKLKTEINKFENACYEAGVQADTFGEAIEHKISDRLKYLIGQFAIDFVVQGLRRIYDNVVQIDAAMTELKKVTDETDEAYEQFLTNAGQRAKELGASLVEVVNMTADYARLGYDVDEASNLADAAIIYRNVGDGLKDADEATDHLISTMKAFGVEASNSMRIVDAFNEVSNNFAVTSSDIGAGLQRSSAAMAAAGNSMEETIALFTAGNTIVRDADTMGTSLKTISMRLRSTKSDLEAMGKFCSAA